MDEEGLKAEVLSVYSAYTGAFLANDVATLNKLIQYPLTYIGKNHSAMMDTYPAELRATKRWHDILGMDQEVVFAPEEKAHVIIRKATRVRADGSTIEVVSAFCALTRTPEGSSHFPTSLFRSDLCMC
jgi:hypothetical protein